MTPRRPPRRRYPPTLFHFWVGESPPPLLHFWCPPRSPPTIPPIPTTRPSQIDKCATGGGRRADGGAFADLGRPGGGYGGDRWGRPRGAPEMQQGWGGTPPPRNETGWGGTSSGGPPGESFNAIFHSGVPTTPPTLKEGGFSLLPCHTRKPGAEAEESASTCSTLARWATGTCG